MFYDYCFFAINYIYTYMTLKFKTNAIINWKLVMEINPASKTVSFKQAKSGLSARKDHILDVYGKGFVEWEFEVSEAKNYIDCLKIRIPDQTIKVKCSVDHDDPDTGVSLDLNDKEFDVQIENVEIDAQKLLLNSIIEPKEIFVFDESARCSFEGEG